MKTISQFRNWQIEALQLGRKAQNFLIQAPGGSGKSLFQVALAQADIIDTGNKQLILVPKNHIHHGFFDEEAIAATFLVPSSRCFPVAIFSLPVLVKIGIMSGIVVSDVVTGDNRGTGDFRFQSILCCP